MRPSRHHLTLLLGALLTGGGSHALAAQLIEIPDPPEMSFAEPANRLEARLQDLTMLEPFLHLDLSYSPEHRAEAGRLLTELRAGAGDLSELAFLIGMHRVVILADNGHSEGRTAIFPYTFGSLPFRGYWFNGSYHIVRTPVAHRDLLGAEVTHFDGRPLEEVARGASTLVQGTMEFFRSVSGDQLLTTPAVLHHLGLIPRPDRVAVTLRMRDGTIETRLLEASPPGREDNPSTAAGRLLFPGFRDGGFAAWLPLEIPNAPLYLRGEDPLARRVSFHRLGQSRTPYLEFRGSSSTEQQSIPTYLDSVATVLGTATFPAIVVDMRLNQGGNMLSAAGFLLGLPARLAPGGKIYVAISNRTFSAGMNMVAMLKRAGGDQVVLIGEPVGDRLRYWSEGRRYALPNSGMRVSYNRGLHDLAAGCGGEDHCYPWWGENIDPKVGDLDPDIWVITEFVEYAEGRDPILERLETLTGLDLGQ